MYSRNRIGTAEEQYRSNLPPVYSGSRFRGRVQEEIPAEDTRRNPPRAVTEEKALSAPPREEIPPQLPPPQEIVEIPTDTEAVPGEKKAEGILHFLGQEEAILIALLLLLSAEHERAMDVIVILLILLGIK